MKTKLILVMLLVFLIGCMPVRIQEVEDKKEHIYYFPIMYCNRDTLKGLFGEHGIRFGFAVSSKSFENEVKGAIIGEHASVVTPEVAMKMEFIQPKRNFYTFGEADKIVRYAQELGIDVHGHTASWSLQNPDWLLDGTFSKDELAHILYNHIFILVHHYEGQLISMDAANEGFLGCGPWCPLGTDNYVRISFDAAKNETPLVYNSLFLSKDEEDKALALLDVGLADGIGIQLHLATTTDWQGALSRTDLFLDRIRKQGGWARFSEVGVHQQNDSESEQQALIYAEITKLAIKHSDIIHDFVIWGITPPMWRGDVGIFDHEGNPKPSYYAIMDELRE